MNGMACITVGEWPGQSAFVTIASGSITTATPWWNYAPAWTAYTVTRAEPGPPPKTWRWFHCFGLRWPDLHWLGDACWPVTRLLHRLLMRCRTEARRHKRKHLLQRLREGT